MSMTPFHREKDMTAQVEAWDYSSALIKPYTMYLIATRMFWLTESLLFLTLVNSPFELMFAHACYLPMELL